MVREVYDLRTCYPVFEGQEERLRLSLQDLVAQQTLPFSASRSAPGQGDSLQDLARATRCEPSHAVALTCSGQAALQAAIAATFRAGEFVAIEKWTFPLGLRALLETGAVPCALRMDREGALPQHLAELAGRGVRGVYLQPTLQNPTGTTMGAVRRQEIAEVAAMYNMAIIEDAAFEFLSDVSPPSFSQILPNLTVRVVSLTKWVGRQLPAGLLEFPSRLASCINEHTRVRGTMANPLCAAALSRLALAGAFKEFAELKRSEGLRRHRAARQILGGDHSDRYAHPFSWAVWIPLLSDHRCTLERITSQGIGVGESSSFCLPGKHDPHVRISLGGEPRFERFLKGITLLAEAMGNRSPVPKARAREARRLAPTPN